MKMRRKTALVVLVLWVFAITSAIAEMTIVEIQPRRYEHIRSVYANVTISGGVATVEGKANARHLEWGKFCQRKQKRRQGISISRIRNREGVHRR